MCNKTQAGSYLKELHHLLCLAIQTDSNQSPTPRSDN